MENGGNFTDKDEHVEILVRLGLTFCQAKIYLALLQLGTSSAKTISNYTNIARPDIYRVIRGLVMLGLVEKSIGKPANFKEAKLKTVRDALSGAFLLNVIHEPAANRLATYGLLKAKYAPKGFGQIHDQFRGQKMQPDTCSPSNTKDPFIIETQLFFYDYEKPVA